MGNSREGIPGKVWIIRCACVGTYHVTLQFGAERGPDSGGFDAVIDIEIARVRVVVVEGIVGIVERIPALFVAPPAENDRPCDAEARCPESVPEEVMGGIETETVV